MCEFRHCPYSSDLDQGAAMKTKMSIRRLAITLICLIGLITAPEHLLAGGVLDPLRLSLAFVGDFQIGNTNWLETRNQNPSSTNIPQLRQTMLDLKRLPNKPALTVFTGDMVMNEVDDQGQSLEVQLSAWQWIFDSMTKPRGMRLLPIAGNHEINIAKVELNAQTPSPYMYDVWLDWLSSNGYARYSGNGPTPETSPADQLVWNDRQMTYSFNLRGTHFVIINTETVSNAIDPTSGLPYAGWIPINWIERDLAAAQRNPAVSTIVVFGHRPIEAPTFVQPNTGTTILNTAEYPLASRLSATLSKYKKVRAYICSHVHAWQAFRLEQGSGVWQIVAGNGGAQLETAWQPEGGQYFGYSILNIYTSGKMRVLNYGRAPPPSPQIFFEDQPVAPKAAALLQRLRITRH
jgi:hypothetical protein